MPELPEVEGVVRALAPIATGRTIMEVTVSNTVIQQNNLGKKQLSKGSRLKTLSWILSV